MYFIHKRIMFVEMYTNMILIQCSLFLAGGFLSGLSGSLVLQWIVGHIQEPSQEKRFPYPKNISHSYCSYRSRQPVVPCRKSPGPISY
jgi:hypothetical protein